MRFHWTALLLITLPFAALRPLPLFSGQGTTMAGDAVYLAVLDRLFPSVGQGNVPLNSRNIVLKFGGNYVVTEMEILIYGQDSKEERYEVWRVPNGNPPVFQQLIKLKAQLKTEDPEVLASSIAIEHGVIKQPSENVAEVAKQLFLPNFPLAEDQGITLDGIYYSFYMKSISNHTRIELIGPSGPFSSHPLIKWMSAMRTAVEAQLKAQKN